MDKRSVAGSTGSTGGFGAGSTGSFGAGSTGSFIAGSAIGTVGIDRCNLEVSGDKVAVDEEEAEECEQYESSH